MYQSLLGFPALEGAYEAWSNRAIRSLTALGWRQLDYQESLARAQQRAAEEEEPAETGALSFRRVADLNR